MFGFDSKHGKEPWESLTERSNCLAVLHFLWLLVESGGWGAWRPGKRHCSIQAKDDGGLTRVCGGVGDKKWLNPGCTFWR